MNPSAKLVPAIICIVVLGLSVASQAWTITATAEAHGSISPSGEVTVADGGSQTYAITPDPGFAIHDLAVDGVLTAAVLTYTFQNVRADHTILARFFEERLCYSTPDTCYVCYDTTWSPWNMVELDLGVCDTIRIGCPVCVDFSQYAVGDSFGVPIYIFSTNAISAFSLGYRHTGRGLRFSYVEEYGGWDPTGGVLVPSQYAWIHYAREESASGVIKTDSGACLTGWFDASDNKPIPRNTTNAGKLLGTVYLTLTDDVPQTIRFDSTFYPPSGPFILSCRDSTPLAPNGKFINMKLTPKFVMCTEVANPRCDINLGYDSTASYPCGDADLSGGVDIGDAVYLISYIFLGGAPPLDKSGGDIDCDLEVTISDAVYYVNYIFGGGPVPCLSCY